MKSQEKINSMSNYQQIRKRGESCNMCEDVLIKAEDYNKTSILLTFESGEQRVLDINHILTISNDSHLSDSIKQRWKIMYEEDDFFKYKILSGDLVFGTWVEIFAEDLKKQTIDFDTYHKFYAE
jgi:hypothetical protein